MFFSIVKLSLVCILVLFIGALVFRPSIGTKSSLPWFEDRASDRLEIRRPYYPIPRELIMVGWGPLEGSFSFFDDPSFRGTEVYEMADDSVRLQGYLINGGFQSPDLRESILVIEHAKTNYEILFEDVNFGQLRNLGGLFPLGNHSGKLLIYISYVSGGSDGAYNGDNGGGILISSWPPQNEVGQVILNEATSDWQEIISSIKDMADTDVERLCSARSKSALAFAKELSIQNCF